MRFARFARRVCVPSGPTRRRSSRQRVRAHSGGKCGFPSGRIGTQWSRLFGSEPTPRGCACRPATWSSPSAPCYCGQPVDGASSTQRTDLHYCYRNQCGDGAGCAARGTNNGRLSGVVAGDCPRPERPFGGVDRGHATCLVAHNRRGHEDGLPTSGPAWPG